MKKEDVPQHGGLNAGCREVNYAVDSDGNYTLESSVGWEAKNIALKQAWEVIVEQLQKTIDKVNAGRMSPLAYHMVKNQMDATLLAQYSGVARWRVKRHLRPEIFVKLNDAKLAPYTDLFSIDVATLRQVPNEPDLPLTELDQSKDSSL